MSPRHEDDRFNLTEDTSSRDDQSGQSGQGDAAQPARPPELEGERGVDRIDWGDLAGLLPLRPTELVFEVKRGYRSTQKEWRLFKVDLAQVTEDQGVSRYLRFKTPHDPDVDAGVWVYREGAHIYYAAFLRKTRELPQGGRALGHDADNAAGAAKRLEREQLQPTTSRAEVKNDLWAEVRPLPLSFDLRARGVPEIGIQESDFTPAITKKASIENDSSSPVTVTTTLRSERSNTLSVELTDTHHVTAGVTLGWQNKASLVTAEVTWSASLSLEYGYESTRSELSGSVHTDAVEEQVTLEVPAKKKRYLALISEVADDVTSTISCEVQLKGSCCGKPMHASALLEMLEAMDDTELVSWKAHKVVYWVRGTATASLSADTTLRVSNKPIQLSQP